jgi:hypothetical protein
MSMATHAIDNGAARHTLARLVALSQEDVVAGAGQ